MPNFPVLMTSCEPRGTPVGLSIELAPVVAPTGPAGFPPRSPVQSTGVGWPVAVDVMELTMAVPRLATPLSGQSRYNMRRESGTPTPRFTLTMAVAPVRAKQAPRGRFPSGITGRTAGHFDTPSGGLYSTWAVGVVAATRAMVFGVPVRTPAQSYSASTENVWLPSTSRVNSMEWKRW